MKSPKSPVITKSQKNRINTKFMAVYSPLSFISIYKISLGITSANKGKGKAFKITAIGNNAFRGYKKLKTVTIGKNVKRIETRAFYNCKKLKKIIIKTGQLQTKHVGIKAFKGIYSKVNIKVPRAKLKPYNFILSSKDMSTQGRDTIFFKVSDNSS